ncbi:hypothetical protein PLESTB_000719300 [Pleodorina starrii]|uniref:Uncharacterized protein n=1 Tax=Pleodorina starrii TaxID=330485 RepID=A0A9W6F1I0_9CHLO|nr:hypothetical protein PLESTM_001708200 [Pleodorina starrii]GLC53203.1 hypothetical protein PLESTB_000719300 [Pleodorina starrii]GLC68658.1 hypothetical protein PLESTF_000719900 [Pleodorina starrii]
MAQLEIDSPFQADARTLLGLVVAILIGAVATAAGVGGGAIYIPLFNVLVGFALKPSTALSQACITAGSLAAVASNLPRTHPTVPGAPLIDLPLMLLLTPLLLVGVGIGVLLNVTLPSWLLNMLLLLLLLLLLAQAVAKGRALWAQETRRAQAAAEAAARHDVDTDSDGGGGGGGGGALLGGDYQSGVSAHPTAQAATAAAGGPPPPAGLRYRRAVSYSGPRGPAGLEPDQNTSLGCLEGQLDGGGSATPAVLSYNPLAAADGAVVVAAQAGGGERRRGGAASVSWDCMEGVTDAVFGAVVGADADGAVGGAVTPTRSGPLPPSVFAAAAARPPSYTSIEEEAPVAAEAAAASQPGVLRSGPGGTTSSGQLLPLTPASSLKYAPSWRAFNELGVLDFETDLAESDGDAGGLHDRRRRSGFGFASAASSSFSPAMPPSARLLSQLLRRPLPPHLQLSTRSPGAAAAPMLPRRTSFDPSTGADLAAAVAAAEAEAGAGAGGGGDSWLQRRSKWRSRFPPGALPHRGGGSRAPLLPPRSAYPRPYLPSDLATLPSPSPSPTPGQQQLPQQRPSSAASSSRASGSASGMTRHRSRSLRLGEADADGGSGDGGGAALAQPLLGPQDEGSDHGGGGAAAAAMIPDPRSEYGGGGGGGGGAPPPPPAAGFTGDAGGAGEAYRPPSRLETLHEEIEHRADLGSGLDPGDTGSSRSRLLPPASSAATSAPVLQQSPFASPVAAAARAPALPASRPSFDWREPAGPGASAQLYSNDGAAAAAAAAAPAVPTHYFQIEDAPPPAARGGGGGRRGRAGRAGGAVAAAARDWAASWAAAGRRVPRRFALGLVAAWVVYLALQGARAFQPQCSPAWWALFVVQIACMLGISAWALLGAATALSRHAAAAEAAAGSVAAADEAVKIDVAAAATAAAELEAEPALSGTAALLVLQAPLATLAATFGAGLTGGLLGLGGGMVMGPLLLQIGVHPQVTAASSGAMVLFSSSAALIQFALLHRLNAAYAAVFGAASLAAGLAGTQAVARAIKRSGRPSLVVLALAGVMALGTVCVATFGMRQAAVQLRSGELGFVGLCDSVGGK